MGIIIYRHYDIQLLVIFHADPPFRIDSSFYGCYTVEELEERIGHGNRSLGTAFYYRDLCLINQIEAAGEWLAIRHETMPLSLS